MSTVTTIWKSWRQLRPERTVLTILFGLILKVGAETLDAFWWNNSVGKIFDIQMLDSEVSFT